MAWNCVGLVTAYLSMGEKIPFQPLVAIRN
jgi:hypothetical protein